MTEPPNIIALIFGQDTETGPCASCGGAGLVGIGEDEIPALCEQCGGGFDAPLFDPDFVARCRPSMTEAELDEEAQAFGKALIAGLLDMEQRLETDELPLASVRQPKLR